MTVICSTNAIIEPNAVMVMSSYTCLANAAVFASCWLQEMTSPARVSREEDGVIVRVKQHILFMIRRRDDR